MYTYTYMYIDTYTHIHTHTHTQQTCICVRVSNTHTHTHTVSLGVLCVNCWPFLIGVYRARRKARIVGERHALLRHDTQ